MTHSKIKQNINTVLLLKERHAGLTEYDHFHKYALMVYLPACRYK